MLVGHMPGYNRKIGESQGFIGLPVRDGVDCYPDGTRAPAMQTLWHPTPDELRDLLSGGAIVLTILGTAHPPVRVEAIGPEALDPFAGQAKPPETGTEGRETKED